MRTELLSWTASIGWQSTVSGSTVEAPQLVLYFGSRKSLEMDSVLQALGDRYPRASLLGCSTGGEIADEDSLDDSIVAVAIEFEHTSVKLASASIEGPDESFSVGEKLGDKLDKRDLQGVFVLSDGLRVNGSELVRGLTAAISKEVPITGGLAGDGPDFGMTLVGANGMPSCGRVAAVGFYGNRLQIGHGSVGGWDVIGPVRTITGSEGNVLYALDGKPALDLYKSYLGDEARNLPGSALLFPLKIHAPDDPETELVRTIVGIDEDAKSLIFAGDMPKGHKAQMMMGNFDHLVDGAAAAARDALGKSSGQGELAILISCIGRKLLMGQRIAEELEAVRSELGDVVPQLGFYSYGEISPHAVSGHCELHNQTMTITVLSER